MVVELPGLAVADLLNDERKAKAKAKVKVKVKDVLGERRAQGADGVPPVLLALLG